MLNVNEQKLTENVTSSPFKQVTIQKTGLELFCKNCRHKWLYPVASEFYAPVQNAIAVSL